MKIGVTTALTCLLMAMKNNMDVVMLQLLNSYERNAEQWADLFKNAHKGFKFLGFRKPGGAALSIIEAYWMETEAD